MITTQARTDSTNATGWSYCAPCARVQAVGTAKDATYARDGDHLEVTLAPDDAARRVADLLERAPRLLQRCVTIVLHGTRRRPCVAVKWLWKGAQCQPQTLHVALLKARANCCSFQVVWQAPFARQVGQCNTGGYT